MKKIGSVNEEYMEAFRTKSYVEILDKMRASNSAFSLSEQVLEPPQSTAGDVSGSPRRVAETLLVEYFQATGKACDLCEILLRGVHLVRENFPETLPRNPFPDVNFRGGLYDELKALFRKIRKEKMKSKRKAGLIRLRKVVAGGSLVLTSTVVAATMLVPALHGVAALLAFAAVPGLAGLSWEAERKDKTTSSRKRGDRLALAGKGVYILIKDLDSLGRLAQRVWDRVDHSRAVADLCLGNGRSGEMAQELLSSHSLQAGFLDLLGELEDHVYLCVVNINRFRKLLIPKILLPTGETSSTRT